mmetsp:Transcript_5216/g.4419  ORF Transcript_5216/g.4419 Transcript_5216/m.4419 type:complete len:87 (-) Transcript_5216:2116-2376(-)|eukprot:CAMPEP_0114591400 /NCGR_PEP_ID=MMETSP0125-20121206/13450_1 /TAXON_ID=485358 ORGANISM="Aristerostoma sp., Strain ATCC 50986" /NCGR_SAMPLE_ID=MMETSP0125 /ASSEMBLY_ACC=CAM_ASM_000245 /LENGTH=86 /DNA_ID=CAMNT_0001789453 /DNA_START=938 /DNA_END=1198 /DNA_ORIENTATION=-
MSQNNTPKKNPKKKARNLLKSTLEAQAKANEQEDDDYAKRYYNYHTGETRCLLFMPREFENITPDKMKESFHSFNDLAKSVKPNSH